MQLEQIKKQIIDTRALITSAKSLLQTNKDSVTQFMLEQDESLLQTLKEQFRNLILLKIGNSIPTDINSAEKLISVVYGSDFKGIVDPFEIAKFFNIEVYRERFIDNSIGRSIFDGARIVIAYRPTQEYRDRFTIAHELGHIFLHFAKGLDYIFVDKEYDMYDQEEETEALMAASRYGQCEDYHYENEANTFASELLVPKKSIQYFLSMVPKGKTVKLTLLREYFKASKPVLLMALDKYRLEENGKIINNIDRKPWL